MDRKVVKIEISNTCIYTYPCQHRCLVYYDDNTQDKMLLYGVTIIQKYFEFLSDLEKEHLKEYINFSDIN